MARKPVKRDPPKRNPKKGQMEVQDWLDQRSGSTYEPDIGGDEFDQSKVMPGKFPPVVHAELHAPTGAGDFPVPRRVIKQGLPPITPHDLIDILTNMYGQQPRGSIRNSSPIILPGDKRLPLSNVPLSGGATGFSTIPLTGGASTLSNVPLSRTPNSLITVLPGRGITQVTNVPQRGQTHQLSHADMLRVLAAHHANRASLAA